MQLDSFGPTPLYERRSRAGLVISQATENQESITPNNSNNDECRVQVEEEAGESVFVFFFGYKFPVFTTGLIRIMLDCTCKKNKKQKHQTKLF